MTPEWLASWAPVILALLAALAAWKSARAASISADMARKEFQVARRPFPYVRWNDARLTEIVTADERAPGQASCYGMTPCQPLIRSSTPVASERRDPSAISPGVGRRDDERSKGASTTSHAAIR